MVTTEKQAWELVLKVLMKGETSVCQEETYYCGDESCQGICDIINHLYTFRHYEYDLRKTLLSKIPRSHGKLFEWSTNEEGRLERIKFVEQQILSLE